MKMKNIDSQNININNISNRVTYYRNIYEVEKKKLSDLKQEKVLNEKNLKSKHDQEKEKVTVLNRLISTKDDLIEKLNCDIKNISTSNKNLLEEVVFYSNHVDFINNQREISQLELNYYKNELDLTKSNLKNLNAQYKKLDNQYTAMSRTLKEYETKVNIYKYITLFYINHS